MTSPKWTEYAELESELAEFCAMAEELDVFVQFRIKHTRNAYLIGNYLDLGPCGVEVPQVERCADCAFGLRCRRFIGSAGRRQCPEGGRQDALCGLPGSCDQLDGRVRT